MTYEPRQTRHPDPETIALFAEGRLPPEGRREVVAHLDGCEECMTDVTLAMGAAGGETRRFRLNVRWLAAAAVLAIVAALGVWSVRDRGPSLDRLVALAPRTERTVEPRLTGGFDWAEYRGGERGDGAMDARRLKLAGAAGELVERAEHDDSAAADHAAGIAMVLVDQPLEAIRHLEAAAEKSNDAKRWSDLAAARSAAAADLGRASLYPVALAAAERALRIDPNLAEALFNRALILERMRLTEDARRAWTRYLEVDPSSKWAGEARQHLAELPASTSSSRFDRERPRLEAAAVRGDAAAVRALVAANRQRARAFGETEYLGLWGEAVARGDGAEAQRLLTVARSIGDALAQESGESLLRESVAAIDRAGDRRALAAAHALYRGGRMALSQYRLAEARRDLLAAKTRLEREGDPMSLAAGCYAAGARLAQHDVRGAREELDALRRAADAHPRFIAAAALVRWELGRAHRLDGDATSAIALLGEGAAMFRRIGEHANEAFLETMLASALASAGRGDDGWSARLRAFGALNTEGDPHLLLASLGSAWRAELTAGRRDAALVLARLADARTDVRPVDRIDALVQRALLEVAAGNDAEAREAAREAEAVAAGIGDPALRAREEADAALAAGAARLKDEPRAAVEALTRTIEFYRAHELPVGLAEPLLLRARALAAQGDRAGAARDLEEGMSVVERHADREAGALDAEHALYEDALRLALDRGDAAQAFAIAERSRGASLTVDRLGQQLAGSGAVVLEIVALPAEVVTFAVSSDAFVVARRERSREALMRLAEESLTENGTRAAAALYDETIRGVEPLLARAQQVIVVPDRPLATVPFAALHDGRRHLVERLPVAIAASAASLVRRPSHRAESLVAIALASGTATETRGLPSAAGELDDIGGLYGRTSNPPATVAVLASDADVLHIAGHTARQPGAGEAALLFGSGAAIERVSSRTIAAAPAVRAEVVVLAACETLRPADSSLTRAPSLGAAFAANGALDVVGTLAAIADRDARVLFRGLHRELSGGAGAAEALRAVQLQAIRNDGPRAWRTVALFTRRIGAP